MDCYSSVRIDVTIFKIIFFLTNGLDSIDRISFRILKVDSIMHFPCLTEQKATLAELELLVAVRCRVLRAANQLPEDTPLPEVESQTRTYYQKAFAENTHTAYLLWDGETLAGTGAVSYFQVMPTVHNPTGRKAYLMNLYTAPQYRRQGIATRILTRLVEYAHRRGVTAISLEATAMGRPLYEKFGFVPMEHEMELPE